MILLLYYEWQNEDRYGISNLHTKLSAYKVQNTNSSSSDPPVDGSSLSFIALSVSAVASLISSRYCNLESFSGAGSLFRYMTNKSDISSGTSHDTGVAGTALSQASKSLREETYKAQQQIIFITIYAHKTQTNEMRDRESDHWISNKKSFRTTPV